MSIFRFLGIEPGEPAPAGASSPEDVASIRRIVQSLDRLEPHQARQIASFAFVLSRVAGADLDISDEEVRAMEKIVMERMGLGLCAVRPQRNRRYHARNPHSPGPVWKF